MREYRISKDECQSNISGVCPGCGGVIEPIETVDNSGAPTYWSGCNACKSFCQGVPDKAFKIARKLVEDGELTPYSHMLFSYYENDPESLNYWYDSQTEGASRIVMRVIRELEAAPIPQPEQEEQE